MLISKFSIENIEDEIKKFEEKYNIVIPEQYKQFLLKYNGGETPESKFRLNRISSDIRGFYGLGKAKEYYNYNYLETSYLFNECLEDGYLQIGENTFGDLILIALNEKEKGKIFFYYHDRAKKYIELAEDFLTFTTSCKCKKIGHIPTIEERRQIMIDNGLGSYVPPERLKGWQAEIDKYNNIHQEELIM